MLLGILSAAYIVGGLTLGLYGAYRIVKGDDNG